MCDRILVVDQGGIVDDGMNCFCWDGSCWRTDRRVVDECGLVPNNMTTVDLDLHTEAVFHFSDVFPLPNLSGIFQVIIICPYY